MQHESAEQDARSRERNTHELIGLDRIRAVVDDFYERIQRHPVLAEPFKVVGDWHEHKQRLVHFWWVSLGGERYRDYVYRVAPVHMQVGVTAKQVDLWLELFHATLLDHLEPELAEQWYRRAANMGRSIRMVARFGHERDNQVNFGEPVRILPAKP